MEHATWFQRLKTAHPVKYPKFLLFFITILLAYLLFYGRTYEPFHRFLVSSGYIGTFIAGVMFAYGFTAAPATAVFLILAKEQNLVIAGLVGGVGALLGDLVIFRFIRLSFADEIKRLVHERFIERLKNEVSPGFMKYFLPIFAGFVIASPLPDEIGVTILALSHHISIKFFAVISFMLNTAGIFLILFIGNTI